MLKQLHIENLAIISSCDISFDEGMTVLTGETGAGKSIIVDAIGLLLGRQASDDWIKSDADTAIIEAVFQVSKSDLSEELQTFVDDLDIVSVSRKLTRNKPSVCRINGESVPLKLLKNLMSPLIAIIGQHEHMTLVDFEAQRQLLDAFGDDSYQGVLQHYQHIYKDFEALKIDYDDLKKRSEEQVSRTSFLSFQIEDIQQHRFVRGEEESLLEQKKLLKLSDKKQTLSENALAMCDSLAEAASRFEVSLKTLRDYFPETDKLFIQATDLNQHISDVAFDVQKSLKALQEEPLLDADALELRLDLIFKYKQKYRVAHLNALCDLFDSVQTELSQLAVVDQTLTQVEERFTVLKDSLEKLGLELYKKRVALARAVEKNVNLALQKLNFSYSDFRILVEKQESTWHSFGCDTVSFLVSTNAGEPAKLLSKVASGGELSRIMLAIRSVFTDVDAKETLIFDEVDTGVGGLTANTVGEFLKAVSQKSQVICVTHLPQIAQLADRHLLVEKTIQNKKTITGLRLLLSGERENELKRMVGGDIVVDRISQIQK